MDRKRQGSVMDAVKMTAIPLLLKEIRGDRL
jgi:hypothetical protein